MRCRSVSEDSGRLGPGQRVLAGQWDAVVAGMRIPITAKEFTMSGALIHQLALLSAPRRSFLVHETLPAEQRSRYSPSGPPVI